MHWGEVGRVNASWTTEDYNGRVTYYNDNDRPSPWSVLQKDVLIHFHRTKREVKAVIDSEVIRLEYVSHLIPLELGGSNSIKNLWPESHRTSPWNAQVKDRLEGKLHELVCSGQLDLKTAQHAIASNWIEAYKLYVGPCM